MPNVNDATSTATPQQRWRTSVFGLGVLWLAVLAGASRLIGLETSPPGFYIDEAAIAAQVNCIRETGTDADGRSFPVFIPILDSGGYTTPAYIYLGAAWTAIFGDSVGAFRAFVAAFGVLTLIGVYVVAQRLWRNDEAALLAALCVAISPWAFLASRIAWDTPLAPCFLVWGLACLYWNARAGYVAGILAALCFALAAYSYMPTRFQVAIMLPLAVIHGLRAGLCTRVTAATTTIGTILALVPLLVLTLNGDLQGRLNTLAIWNNDYLRMTGDTSMTRVFAIFLQNFADHFSLDYLFVHGDANLRHSTGAVGQWGWLDALALLTAIALLLARRIGFFRRHRASLALCAVGYVAAVIPAALTWEGHPHALRSIGAFPFLALLAGSMLAAGTEAWSKTRPAILVVAVAFMAWFGYDFFAQYPERARTAFHAQIREAIAHARTTNPDVDLEQVIRSVAPNYPSLPVSYYLHTCRKQAP